MNLQSIVNPESSHQLVDDQDDLFLLNEVSNILISSLNLKDSLSRFFEWCLNNLSVTKAIFSLKIH